MTNPSVTSLTANQNRKINNLYNAKYNPKKPKNQQEPNSQLYNNQQNKIQRSGLALISSTGGNSFLKMNNMMTSNSNYSNNLIQSNLSNNMDHSTSQISNLRKSPTASHQMTKEQFQSAMSRKPSYGNLGHHQQSNNINSRTQRAYINRPSSGRPNNHNRTQNHQQIQQPQSAEKFKTHLKNPMIQSMEQISVNLHSSNASMSSTHRSGTGGKYKSGGMGSSSTMGNSQKLKMLKIISQQQNSVNFSKTLKSYQGETLSNNGLAIGNNLKDDPAISEEEFYQKEEQLSIIHKELKNRSIEILTDQLMLKDKEIATLKKQLDLMRNQLFTQTNVTQQSDYVIPQQQSNNHYYYNNSGSGFLVNNHNLNGNQLRNQLHIYEQQIEEERKSTYQNNQGDDLSFDGSSLHEIQQKEDPYLHIGKKTLQRAGGKQLGSQQNIPLKGLVRCGSSQLNNKLGKMKSTADLFGGIRQKMKDGETIQDFIMKQQVLDAPNLEDVIKESMIENSQSQSIIQAQMMDDDIQQSIQLRSNKQNQVGPFNEKSLSLNGDDEQSSKILDQLFTNRETKFDVDELERLVNFSQNIEGQVKHTTDASQRPSNIQRQAQKFEYIQRNLQTNAKLNEQSSIYEQSPKNTDFSPIMNLQSHNSSQHGFMLFEGQNRLLYEQEMFNDSPYNDERNQESQQVIMRNEDSFTSKQTNEYLRDLLLKHQISDSNMKMKERFSHAYGTSSKQAHGSSNKKGIGHVQYLDESPSLTSRRSGSNDTARLSFSKEDKAFNINPMLTQSSQDKRQIASPQNLLILQTQSLNSIGDLLKEASSPSNGQKFQSNQQNIIANNQLRKQNKEPMNYIEGNTQQSINMTQYEQINTIKNLNLVTKKSIEFSSPPSANMTKGGFKINNIPKVQQTRQIQQQYGSQSSASPIKETMSTNAASIPKQSMSRQKSNAKIGNHTGAGMALENQGRKLINHINKLNNVSKGSNAK
ncbi:UNKNOWN [Stylonychia lemnae]|uniref:Uncharacterized protein n=1 Tax=Stylonychia lemnae TaxID=5949 RepID=A0A078A1T2_STYLE|nr:UNKNOWN [Stylonychia lemnae]|eukprot:CDW75792.1 UNKNOWN [Stylonychia lemnae]